MFEVFFGTKLLAYPLNIIPPIIFFTGLFLFSNYSLKYCFNNCSNDAKRFIPIFWLGIFCGVILILLFFNTSIAQNIIRGIFFFFFFICVLEIFKKKFTISKFKIERKFFFQYKFFFYILIILYLFLSSLPISDADSLAYHYAFGKYAQYFNNIDFLRDVEFYFYNLFFSGYGEVINFIGLTLYSDVFSSFSNYFSIYLLYSYFEKNKKKYKLLVFILSAPIILISIYSQKIYFGPCIIISLIIYSFYKSTIKINDLFIILSSLFFCLSIKVSFLIIILFLNFYIFFKFKLYARKNIYYLLLIILSFFVFFSPFILKNLIYHSDLIPPFTKSIFGLNTEKINVFSIWVKTYDVSLSLETLTLLPLLFLIPHYGEYGKIIFKPSEVGKIYGLQFYNFFFSEKKIDKKFLALVAVIFLSVILSLNISTRWFLIMFLILQFYFFDKKIKANFEILLKLQSVIYILILSSILIAANFYLLFDGRDKFFSKYAYGYNLAKNIKKLKNKLDKKNNFYAIYSHRAKFWSDFNNKTINLGFGPNPVLIKKNKKYYFNSIYSNYLSGKPVKLIVVLNEKDAKETVVFSMINSCKVKFYSLNEKVATRNPFHSSKVDYLAIFIENGELKNCFKKINE